MKTVGIRALRENPGILSQVATKGEYLLVTNRNNPVSLSIPFNDELLSSGVHINVAVKLYEDGVLTLSKASRLAKMSVEVFVNTLANFDVLVVDQTAEELASDLKSLDE